MVRACCFGMFVGLLFLWCGVLVDYWCVGFAGSSLCGVRVISCCVYVWFTDLLTCFRCLYSLVVCVGLVVVRFVYVVLRLFCWFAAWWFACILMLRVSFMLVYFVSGMLVISVGYWLLCDLC